MVRDDTDVIICHRGCNGSYVMQCNMKHTLNNSNNNKNGILFATVFVFRINQTDGHSRLSFQIFEIPKTLFEVKEITKKNKLKIQNMLICLVLYCCSFRGAGTCPGYRLTIHSWKQMNFEFILSLDTHVVLSYSFLSLSVRYTQAHCIIDGYHPVPSKICLFSISHRIS